MESSEASVAPEPAPSRIARIAALLSDPKAEWVRIAAEPMSVRTIMLYWVAPIAAIGPVAKLIGSQILRYTNDGMHAPPLFVSAFTEAVLSFLFSLVGVYVLALVVNGLAVTFKGRREFERALKLAAYGATPTWLAMIFEVWPPLRWLEACGLYSLYLIWVGLPILMHVPRKRALAYTAVTLLTAIGMTILTMLLVLWMRDMFTPEFPASAWNYTPPNATR